MFFIFHRPNLRSVSKVYRYMYCQEMRQIWGGGEHSVYKEGESRKGK
jgi:hypothetical protein